MKKISFIILVLVSSISAVRSQWQPEVRLTNDTLESYTSDNNARCIASSNDSVHVVSMDNRDGNFEIYYKRSRDKGITWEFDRRLTNAPGVSTMPSIALYGNVIQMVWEDWREGNNNNEIYYKRSTDAGTTWGPDTRLTNNSFSSARPSLAVSGSVLHVVWHDNRGGFDEVYYKRSTDGGITWGSDIRLSDNDNSDSYYAAVASSIAFVHVIWYDTRNPNQELYYKRSTDGGTTWGNDTRVTQNQASSKLPSIAVSGAYVHLVWEGNRSGAQQIYYNRSTNYGISWGTEIRLTDHTLPASYPSVAVSGSAVHVVWWDDRIISIFKDIYYRASFDNGSTWFTDIRISLDPSYSNQPGVAVSGQVVHVVWVDSRDANYEIYYRRNPTGNPIGINQISSEIPTAYIIEQNFPNPFNPVTKIRFQLPENGFVNLQIFDALGRNVSTLVNENLNAGEYEAEWNAVNQPSGIYFYKITTSEFSEVKKMVLIK